MKVFPIRPTGYLFSMIAAILLGLCFGACQTNTSSLQKSNKSTISIEKGDSLKLKFTSSIRSLYEDSKGNFWIGSDKEGVCLYNGQTFEYFTTLDSLSNNQIRSIQEDDKGNIWFGTGDGILMFNGYGMRTMNPNKEFIDQEDFSTKDLWFNAGNKSGTYRYNGGKLQFIEFPKGEDIGRFNLYAMTGFAKSKFDKIWISTYSGAFGFDGKNWEVIDDELLGIKEEIKQLHIRSVFEDSKGRLWIGNNGIGVLLKEDYEIVNFSEKQNLHFNAVTMKWQMLQRRLEHVFTIEEDDNGNIWFGDRDTGAWKFDGEEVINYGKEAGLTSSFVQTIYRDTNGKLWFGLSDGNLFSFNGEKFIQEMN